MTQWAFGSLFKVLVIGDWCLLEICNLCIEYYLTIGA